MKRLGLLALLLVTLITTTSPGPEIISGDIKPKFTKGSQMRAAQVYGVPEIISGGGYKSPKRPELSRAASVYGGPEIISEGGYKPIRRPDLARWILSRLRLPLR